MAGSHKAATMRRRGFLGLSLLMFALTVAVGAWLWQAVELASLSRVSDQVERLKPAASAVRLAVIGLLAASWPNLVELGYRYGRIADSQRDHLLAQRWRVVGWLLVIELVLGQNLFGRFLAVTTGPIV